MRNAFTQHITRWRLLGSIAAVAVVTGGAVLSSSVVQGRIDPLSQQPTRAVVSPNTIAIVTGGGTVIAVVNAMNVVASFGVNGKRPAGFVQNGAGSAQGRINYDEHAQTPNRHVNVPVTFMNASISATPTPNGTGGEAQLIGDCTAPLAECPAGFQSVLVHVIDNSDSGANSDVFEIFFCAGPASATPTCNPAPEASGTLRTGNIQVRSSLGAAGATAPTAARAPLRLP